MKRSKVASLVAGRPGEDAVRRATGQSWAHWFGWLDRAGASALNHRTIAHELGAAHPSLSPWWRQMITVHYERARGLRVKHQKCDGSFSASASKTIAAPVAAVFEAWRDARRRRRWLAGAPVRIRRSRSNQSLRLVWDGGPTEIDVQFSARGRGKTVVALDHERLPDAATVARQKSYWRPALDRLKALLES